MAVINPIPGQESRNSDYLLENGAAVKINNIATLAHKLTPLLRDADKLERLKENARTTRQAGSRLRHRPVALDWPAIPNRADSRPRKRLVHKPRVAFDVFGAGLFHDVFGKRGAGCFCPSRSFPANRGRIACRTKAARGPVRRHPSARIASCRESGLRRSGSIARRPSRTRTSCRQS